MTYYKNEPDLYNDVVGQSEDALQQKCYFWFWNAYPKYRGLLFHIPNGGSRSKREAKKFKQIGVVSGVADLTLLFNGYAYFIELKAENGTQSSNQKKWQKSVTEEGFNYYLIYSLKDFKLLVNGLIDGWKNLLGE